MIAHLNPFFNSLTSHMFFIPCVQAYTTWGQPHDIAPPVFVPILYYTLKFLWNIPFVLFDWISRLLYYSQEVMASEDAVPGSSLYIQKILFACGYVVFGLLLVGYSIYLIVDIFRGNAVEKHQQTDAFEAVLDRYVNR